MSIQAVITISDSLVDQQLSNLAYTSSIIGAENNVVSFYDLDLILHGWLTLKLPITAIVICFVICLWF